MTGKVLKDGAIINPDAGRKPASPEGKPTVTVLDYGSGNVRSAVRALERAGAEVILSSKPEDVCNFKARNVMKMRVYYKDIIVVVVVIVVLFCTRMYNF